MEPAEADLLYALLMNLVINSYNNIMSRKNFRFLKRSVNHYFPVCNVKTTPKHIFVCSKISGENCKSLSHPLNCICRITEPSKHADILSSVPRSSGITLILLLIDLRH